MSRLSYSDSISCARLMRVFRRFTPLTTLAEIRGAILALREPVLNHSTRYLKEELGIIVARYVCDPRNMATDCPACHCKCDWKVEQIFAALDRHNRRKK